MILIRGVDSPAGGRKEGGSWGDRIRIQAERGDLEVTEPAALIGVDGLSRAPPLDAVALHALDTGVLIK
jgi:hypothetical protein